jgi:HD superfamily phosphohydrolase
MYHIREQLHRTAYQHKVCYAIERMLIDALAEANKHYHFDIIVDNHDLDRYILLNDTIYIEILNSVIAYYFLT